MIGRSSGIMRSHKVRGRLWLLAGFPMIVGPTVFNGNQSIIVIGMLFLILGIVELRRK